MALNGDPFSDPMGLGPLADAKPLLPDMGASKVSAPPAKPTAVAKPKAQPQEKTGEALTQNLASRGLSFRPDVGLYSMEEEQGGKKIMMSPLGYAYLEPTDARATKGKGWYRVDDTGMITEDVVPSPITAPAKLVGLPDGSATMQIGDAVWKNDRQGAKEGPGLYTPYGKLGNKREAVYRNAAKITVGAAKAAGGFAKGLANEIYATGKGLTGAGADYVKTLKDLAVGDLKFSDFSDQMMNTRVGEATIGTANRAQTALGITGIRGAVAEREANDAQALLDEFTSKAPKDATQIPMAYLQQIASGGDQTADALKQRQRGAVESTVLSQQAKVAKEMLDVLGITPNVRQSEAGTPPGISLHDLRLFVEAKQRLASYRMAGNSVVTLKNAFADEKLEDLKEDHQDVLLAAHALPKRDKSELSTDPEFGTLFGELTALKARVAKIPEKNKAELETAGKQAMDLAYRMNRLAVKPENRKQFDAAFSKWGEAGRLKSEFQKWLPESTDSNAMVRDYEQILQGDAAKAGALTYDVAAMVLGAKTLGVKGLLEKLGTGWMGTTTKALAQSAAFSAPSLPEQIKGSIERAEPGKETGTVLKDLAVRAGLDTVMFSEKLAKMGIPGDTVKRVVANKATRATGLAFLSSLAETMQTGEPMDPEAIGRTWAHFAAWEAKSGKDQIAMIPARKRLTETYDSADSARHGIELARTQRTQEFAKTALALAMDPEGKDAPLLRTKISDLQNLLSKGIEDEAALQSMEHIPGKAKFRGPTSIAAPDQTPDGNGQAPTRKSAPIPAKKPAVTGPDAEEKTASPKSPASAVPQAPIAGTEGMERAGSLAQGVVEKIDRLTQITEDKAEAIKRLEDPAIPDEEFSNLSAEMDEAMPKGVGWRVQDGKFTFYNQSKGMAKAIDLDAAKAAAAQAKQAVQVSPEPAPLPAPKPAVQAKNPEPQAAREGEPPTPLSERRTDAERRKTVDEMTPEERADALLMSSKMPGIPNARALEEEQQATPRKHTAFLDLDNFKDVNDLMGHKAGDQVLHEIGLDLQVLRNGFNEGRPENEQVKPFHLSGDEVVVTSDNPEALAEFMETYRESISKKKVRVQDAEGKWHKINHPGVSYGIGESQDAAEVAAQADKQARRAAGLRHQRGERPADVPAAEPRIPGSRSGREVLPEPKPRESNEGVKRPRLTDIKIEDEEMVPEELAVFSVPSREKELPDGPEIQSPSDLHRVITEQTAMLKEAGDTPHEPVSAEPSSAEPAPKGGFFDALKTLRDTISGGRARMDEALARIPKMRDKAFFDRKLRLEALDELQSAMRTVYPKLSAEQQAAMRAYLPNVMKMATSIGLGSTVSLEGWNKFRMNANQLGSDPENLTLLQEATKIRTAREMEANPDLPDPEYGIHEGERETHADRLNIQPKARTLLIVHELGASLKNGAKMLAGLDAQIAKTQKLIASMAHNDSLGRWPRPEDRAKRLGRRENLDGQLPPSNEVKSEADILNEAYGTEHRLLNLRKDLVKRLDVIRKAFGPDKGWLERREEIVANWDRLVRENAGGKTLGGLDLDWAPNAKGEAMPLPYRGEAPIWNPGSGKEISKSTYQGGTRRDPVTGRPLSGNYYSEEGWTKGLQRYLETTGQKKLRLGDAKDLNALFGDVIPEEKGHPAKVVDLFPKPEPEGKPKVAPAEGGFIQGQGATVEERNTDANRQFDEIQEAVNRSAQGPALAPPLSEDLKGVPVALDNLRLSWTPREITDPVTGKTLETDSILGRLQKAGYVVIPGSRNEMPRTQDRMLQLPKGHRVIFERDLATILGNAADPEVLVPAKVLEKVRRPGDYQDMDSDARAATAKDVNRMNTPEEDADAILKAEEVKGFTRRVMQARVSDAAMLKTRRVEMLNALVAKGILTPDDFMDSSKSLERLDGWSAKKISELSSPLQDEIHTEMFRLMSDPEFRIRPTAKGIWTRDMLALVEQAANRKGIAEELSQKVQEFMESEEGRAVAPEDLGAKIFELSGMSPEDLGIRTSKVPGQRIPAGIAAPRDVPERPFYTVRNGKLVAMRPPVPTEIPASGIQLEDAAPGARRRPPVPSRTLEPTDRNRWMDQPTPGLDNPAAKLAEGWTLKPFSAMRGSDLPKGLRLMVAKKMLSTAADNVLWRHLDEGKPLSEGDRRVVDTLLQKTALDPGEEFLDQLYQNTGTAYGQPIRMMTEGGYAETVEPKLQEALLREGHPRFNEALGKITESMHELTPQERAKVDTANLPDETGEAGIIPEGEGADPATAQVNQEAGRSSGNRSVRFSLEDYAGEATDLTPDMEGLRELVAVNREHLANLSPDRRFTMSDLNGVVLEQARTLWRNVFGASEEGLAKKVWLAVNEAEDPERVSRYRHKVDQVMSAVDLISKPEEAIRFLESGGILSPRLKAENRRLVDFVKDNRQMVVDLVNNLDPRLVEQFKFNTHPYGGRGVMGVMNFARDLVKVYGNWKNAFDQIRNESAMTKLGHRIKAMGALPKEIGYQMTRNARAEASVRTVKVAVHETFHFLEQHLDPEIQETVLQAHREARDAFYADPRNKGLAMLFGPGGMASDLLGGRSLVDVDDYAGDSLRKYATEHQPELEKNGYELENNTLYFDGKEAITWDKSGAARIVAPGDAYRFASPSEFFAETAADILTGASRMGEGNLTERVSEYSSGVHSRLVNFIGSAGDLIGSFGFKTLNRMKPEHLGLMRDLIQDAIGSSEHYTPERRSPLQKIAQDREMLEVEDAWADHVQSRDRLFRIAEASRPDREWPHDYEEDASGRPKKRSNLRLIRKGMQAGPVRTLGKLIQATCSADSMSDETLALSQLANPTVLRTMGHLQADAYHLEGNFSGDPGGRAKSTLDKSVLQEHNGYVARMLEPEVKIAWNKRQIEGYGPDDAPGVMRVEIPSPGEKSGKMGYQVQYDPKDGKLVNYMSDRTAQMWHYLETDGQVSGDLLRPNEIKALDSAREYLREANKQIWEELASQPGIDRTALDELQKMNPGIWIMRRYTLNGEKPSNLHYQTIGMDFLPEAIDEIQSVGKTADTPRDALNKALHRTQGMPPTSASFQGPAREASRVKARSFKTLQEAMQHGYMSKFRNPIDAAIEGRRQLSNLILFRETVGHMEDMNLAVLASKNNRLDKEAWVEYPLGGSKLTNRLLGFDYKRALLTPKEVQELQDGVTFAPDVRLYVHASAVPLMNSVFGKGYSTQKWYRTVADINAHLNPIQLLGLFHLGTTAGILNVGARTSSIASDLVRSLYRQNRENGLQPKEAYRAAWQHMKAARDVGNMWDGGKSMQSLLIDHAFETPDQIHRNEHISDVQKAFVRMCQVGGLHAMRNPLSEKQAIFSKAGALSKKTGYDHAMDYLNNGIQNTKAGVFTLESVMQKFQSGMMGGIIAPVKLGYASDNFGRFIAHNYDITKDGWLGDLERDLMTPGSKATKYALEVGDRADDIFGMSNIRKLYMDPRAKDLVTILTRAFTWHKGNNRILLKGFDEALSTIPGVREVYGKTKGLFGGHLIDKDAPRLGAAFIAAHTATTLAMNALIFGLLYKAGVSGFSWSDEREDASGVRKAMLSLKDLAFPIQADTHGESFRRFDGSQRRMHEGYLKEWNDLVMNPIEGTKGLLVKGRSPVFELGKAVTLAALGQEKYPDLPYGNPEEAQLMPQTTKDYLTELIDQGESGDILDKAKAATARMAVEVYNAPTPMTAGTLEKLTLRHSDAGETVPTLTKALYLLGMRDVPMESNEEEK